VHTVRIIEAHEESRVKKEQSAPFRGEKKMKSENMKEANYEYLLGGLLLIILSVAIAREVGVIGDTRRLFLEPALCLILLIGVWSMVSEKKWLIIGGGIGVIGVATAAINFFWGIPELRFFNLGVLFLFFLASTWVAFQKLLSSDSIDVNKIIGGICIYLLLGITWAFFYLFINIVIPNSFDGLTSTEIGDQFIDLMYYSFVTLTTLGYGDLIPVRPLARIVAYLEAIVGQFYVAVLVAWLVAMYLYNKQFSPKP
jgi:voltage-gated potassium channel